MSKEDNASMVSQEMQCPTKCCGQRAREYRSCQACGSAREKAGRSVGVSTGQRQRRLDPPPDLLPILSRLISCRSYLV